jgi:hypothetical protein
MSSDRSHDLTTQVFQCQPFLMRQPTCLARHPRDFRATDRFEALLERTRYWTHAAAPSQRKYHASRRYPLEMQRYLTDYRHVPGSRRFLLIGLACIVA